MESPCLSQISSMCIPNSFYWQSWKTCPPLRTISQWKSTEVESPKWMSWNLSLGWCNSQCRSLILAEFCLWQPLPAPDDLPRAISSLSTCPFSQSAFCPLSLQTAYTLLFTLLLLTPLPLLNWNFIVLKTVEIRRSLI